jgi:hypothetical protein
MIGQTALTSQHQVSLHRSRFLQQMGAGPLNPLDDAQGQDLHHLRILMGSTLVQGVTGAHWIADSQKAIGIKSCPHPLFWYLLLIAATTSFSSVYCLLLSDQYSTICVFQLTFWKRQLRVPYDPISPIRFGLLRFQPSWLPRLV